MVVAGRNHNGAPSLAWERWHGTQQAYELDETVAGGAPPAREVADLELPQPDPVPPRLDLTSPSRIGPGSGDGNERREGDNDSGRLAWPVTAEADMANRSRQSVMDVADKQLAVANYTNSI
ncbi:hypothetical protein OsI_32829 [Oryza sativa Indica Group]|jgi:hypothetical protein|uniref:Uncharacterized protein n=1 Tax=Oryza sativa subsp. indica TaxID=39946 RepID=A2Z5A5_ORYSI|nr:hypothetical protein OsI_32829 [Oryza sativa Indica Group]